LKEFPPGFSFPTVPPPRFNFATQFFFDIVQAQQFSFFFRRGSAISSFFFARVWFPHLPPFFPCKRADPADPFLGFPPMVVWKVQAPSSAFCQERAQLVPPPHHLPGMSPPTHGFLIQYLAPLLPSSVCFAWLVIIFSCCSEVLLFSFPLPSSHFLYLNNFCCFFQPGFFCVPTSFSPSFFPFPFDCHVLLGLPQTEVFPFSSSGSDCFPS